MTTNLKVWMGIAAILVIGFAFGDSVWASFEFGGEESVCKPMAEQIARSGRKDAAAAAAQAYRSCMGQEQAKKAKPVTCEARLAAAEQRLSQLESSVFDGTEKRMKEVEAIREILRSGTARGSAGDAQ